MKSSLKTELNTKTEDRKRERWKKRRKGREVDALAGRDRDHLKLFTQCKERQGGERTVRKKESKKKKRKE